LRSLAVVAGIAAFTVASAQERPLHIGILSSGSLTERGNLEQSLMDGLRAQGYVEGRNLVVERRYAKDALQQVPQFANELAAMKLQAIVTTCTPTTRFAKQATSTIPIVMAAVSDPVGQGLVASLARPGANVTGRSSQAEDLLEKRLEMVVEILPKARTIGVLSDARNPVHAASWGRLQAAADRLKRVLTKYAIASPEQVGDAVKAAAADRVDALFVMPDDPILFNKHALIVELAAKYRLPDFYWVSDYADAGGLMSYGENLRDSYGAAAAYVARIASGADPAQMPVAQPTSFELVVNLKTATTLGLKIPQAVLVRADRIIR
jgi:putative ABC transport system substrate-binding protein